MKLVPVHQWVASALDTAKLPQAEAARRLTKELRRDIDRAAVNKMLSGKRDVTAEEMLALEAITGFPVPSPHVETKIPLISWVSAGQLADVQSQIPVEDVPLLAFADLGRGDFFALKVAGDSMDRISPEGSVIVVNRADRQLVADRPYVFSRRGEATYTLWQPNPPHLAPFSWNPANKPIFVKGKRDFTVIGRVRRTVLDL
jgi:SOS-response transcriptional repressor LexA